MIQDFDCFATIPITSVETGEQIKNINFTIKNLWVKLRELLAIENIYSPYSDRINPLFLTAAERLFGGSIEADCKTRAMASFEKSREYAIAGDADELYCELLVAQYWLVLGASIGVS